MQKFFAGQGIVSDAEVSVAIVGEAKMLELSKKYLKNSPAQSGKKIHNVLSFTNDELKTNFIYPQDGTIRLGEIVVCYPETVREASLEGKMIEDKVLELIEHSGFHLLGIHHKE